MIKFPGKKDKYNLIDNHIIEVPITIDCLNFAKEKTKKGVVNTNRTVIGGEAWLTGNIGEELFEYYFRPNIKQDCFDYDFIWNGEKIDIKTHSGNFTPNITYNVNIMSYTIDKQNCDSYCFIRVHEFHKKAWFLGYIKKKDFIINSVLHKKGEITTHLNKNFEYKADQYVLQVSKLQSMKEWIK